MSRGQGVMLQRYRDGGLSDAKGFRLADGLSWTMGGETGRTRTETDLLPWRAARGAAGRMPPNGFPRDNRFGCRHGEKTPSPFRRLPKVHDTRIGKEHCCKLQQGQLGVAYNGTSDGSANDRNFRGGDRKGTRQNTR